MLEKLRRKYVGGSAYLTRALFELDDPFLISLEIQVHWHLEFSVILQQPSGKVHAATVIVHTRPDGGKPPPPSSLPLIPIFQLHFDTIMVTSTKDELGCK